jgi:hypothetical protein
MKATFTWPKGGFASLMDELHLPVAEAGSAAIGEASEQIKTEARASIVGAGFSRGWANALRVEVYPKGGKPSIDSATFVWHRIPYAGVFEEGATISGNPLMWLPLPGAPRKIGRFGRMTPKLYRQKIGPLFRMPGTKKPILAATIRANRTPAKVSTAALRRGSNPGGRGKLMAIPLFVGIDQTTIKKRFDVIKATEKAAANLPSLFAKNFRGE